MGRPNIQIVDRTQLVVTEEDDFITKSDKSTKQTTKKAHNFPKVFVRMKLCLKDTLNNELINKD